jgi:dCTP deaminase
MTPLADHQIRALAHGGMITPYSEAVGAPAVSYGLTSYGYDMRIDAVFRYPQRGIALDPKRPELAQWIDVQTHEQDVPYAIDPYVKTTDGQPIFLVMPPYSFVLGRSVERFRIPRNVTCTVLGKSTYARNGTIVNVTPLEPEWEGHVTIEISNTAPLASVIYIGEGIAQVQFWQADATCEVSYADKKGKYQGQVDVTEARM